MRRKNFLNFGFLLAVSLIFSLGFAASLDVQDDLHLNIQTLDGAGEVITGTFNFQFNITTDPSCSNVIYSDSQSLTTDSRGIVSVYLNDTNLDYDNQYYLCYYRDSSLIDVTQIARTPYAFRSKYVNSSGIQIDSGLDFSGYNLTADYFIGDGSLLTNLNVSAIDLSSYVPYTGANQNLVLGANNFSVNTNTLFVDSNNGRVGIGTTNPQGSLHVVGNFANTGGYTYTDGFRGYTYGGGIDMKSTGIDFYTSTDDIITFTTRPAGVITEQMRLTSEGKFGINTINPQRELHVNGDILSNATINATGDICIEGGICLSEAGTGSGNVIGTGSANQAAFWTAGDTISSDGNFTWDNTNKRLGIGTNIPQNTFHINSGTTDVAAKFESTDTRVWLSLVDDGTTDFTGFGVSNNDLVFRTDLGDISFRASDTGLEQTRMTILNSGNVGIGTDNPNYKLDVLGNINIDSSSAYLYDGVQILKAQKLADTVYSTISVGAEAGYLNTGSYSTAIGYNAGRSNSGSYQAAMGYYAGGSNTGTSQSAFGFQSGYSNIGNYQTVFGRLSGQSNTGDYQIGFGYDAGRSNAGDRVIGIGYQATRNNTVDDVIAIGYQAGYNNYVPNQFILQQANINSVPLIQGDFATGLLNIQSLNATGDICSSGGCLNDVVSGNINSNSSNYWDGLDTPSDILGSEINNDLIWLNASGVVDAVGNWSSEKDNYYTKTETYNQSEIDSMITSGTANNTNYFDSYDSSYFMPLNTSVYGQFDFNGGWTGSGVSIVGGAIYAQSGYFYDINSLQVTNLEVNGSLIPDLDNQFDVGNSTMRWKDAYFSGEINASSFVGDGSGLTNVNGSTQWKDSGSDIYYNEGNVGIGTDSPSYKLVVLGNISSDGQPLVLVNDISGLNGLVPFEIKSSGNSAKMRFQTDGNNKYWDWVLGSSGEMRFDSNDGIYKMYLTNNAKPYSFYANNVGVGIGTNVVNNDLTVNGSADFSGNVGIGTTTPQNELNVVGDLNVTGTIYGATFDGVESNWNVSGTNLYPADLSYNVGIGTDVASYPLTINSSNGNIGRLSYGGNNATIKMSVAGGVRLDTDVHSTLYGLGIGMDPIYALDVSGTIRGTGFRAQAINSYNTASDGTLNLPSGSYPSITRNQADSRPTILIQNLNAGSTGDILQLKNDSTTLMVVDVSGKVGIGTTTPQNELNVVGDLNVTGTIYGASFDGVESNWNVSGTNLYPADLSYNVGIGTASPQSILNINGSVGSLSGGLSFGDGDTGIYEIIDDALVFRVGGVNLWQTQGTAFKAASNSGIRFDSGNPTSTTPNLMPSNNDLNTGLGWAGADKLSLISGGVEGLRINNDSSIVFGDLNVTGNVTSQTDFCIEGGDCLSSVISSSGNVSGSGIVNQAAFWTAGDTISSDGNFTWDNTNKRLGIGTDSPSEALDIYHGNLQITGIEEIQDAQLKLSSDGVGFSWILGHDDTQGFNNFYITQGTGLNDAKFVVANGGNVGIGTSSPQSILNINGSIGSLSGGLTFGDGNTGFYEVGDNLLAITAGGDYIGFFNGDGLKGSTTGAASITIDTVSSTTSPGHNFRNDENTGVGWAGADQLSLVAGGVEIMRLGNESLSTVYGDLNVTGNIYGANSGGYWNLSGSNLYPTSTNYNVGIGTTNPGNTLSIVTSPRTEKLGIGTKDTGSVFNHTEDSTDATNGHGGFFFISNAVKTSTNELFNIENAGGNIMTITNAGDMGINTAVPSHSLMVDNQIWMEGLGTGNVGQMYITSEDTTSISNLWLSASSNNGANVHAASIQFQVNNGTGSTEIAEIATTHSESTGRMSFYLDNSRDFEFLNGANSRLFIEGATGNIGIGTTEPFNNVAGGTADYSLNPEGIHIKGDNLFSVFESGAGINDGVNLELISNSASANEKVMALINYDGKTWFRSRNDDLTTNKDGILVMEHSTGNVGIGDISPDAKLDIYNSGSGASFRVDDASDGDSTPFIIDNDGNVGIGVSSPGTKLDVGGTSDTTNRAIRITTGDSYNAGFEAYGASQGTGYLYVGQSSTYGGGISYNGDGTPVFATGESADRITFFRRNAGTTSEVFSYGYSADQVDFNGDITAVGEIRQGATDYGGYEIQTGGQMYVNDYIVAPGGVHVGGTADPGTDNLVVDANVTALAYYYSSDERLKTNVKIIESSLDKIKKLEGVSFNWRADGQASMGLIAQDVEKVFPELVGSYQVTNETTNETTTYKTVQYGNLVAPLIEAVKELDKKNEEQDKKLDEQAKEIEELKKEIDEIKSKLN
ncbi:hypothetical protein GW932_03025 [archaeon]|nr:hypothetical protein [archaeon]